MEMSRVLRGGFLLANVLLLVGGCAAGRGSEKLAADAEGVALLSSGWRLQDVAKIKDSGPAISRAGYSPTDWFPATVPGTVLTSLVNDGVYPEPLYGENNRPDKIPESLCRTSYWYRTQFVVPSDYSGKRVWLNFEGINYIADVWINGERIGEIKGAFARGLFDVTPFVRPGAPAAVAVLISPPPHPGNPKEQTAELGTGGNGGALAQDGPTFIASVGWDWIPAIRDRNMGIWRNVSLSSTGPVIVQDPLVTSELSLPNYDSADVSVEATLRNASDVDQAGTLRGTVGDVGFSTPVTLAAGKSQTVKLTSQSFPQLRLQNPRLWWPNGYGDPNLYQLRLSFIQNGLVSDSRAITFGIRKITYEVPESQNLAVSVNGVRVMCKGGNWGMDEAMKRIPRERLEAQIRLHQLANFTMIRNWVGQSTSEDFYDLCDRYGIMVWDEFFQPNKSDGPNPDNVPLYLANAREKIVRFRNHPSIAIWCGRNESDPAPAPVADGLRKLMEELDPTRTYHANSNEGRGVRSGGPYSWQTPQRYYAGARPPGGTTRPLATTLSSSTTRPATGPGTPTTAPRGGGRGAIVDSFKTEIGPVSIPTLEAVRAMMPAKDWEEIDNDDWAEHDLCKGAQEGRNGPLYSEVISQRYGKYANLADFVRKAQLANYEAHRALYEGRFARLFTPYTGVLLWMSNPAQPSMVWQLYSHDLEPNASLFAVRRACEPVHVQMNQNDSHVMVINNTPGEIRGLRASVRVFNLEGVLKHQQESALIAKASAATDAGAINFPQDLSPVHFVKVALHDGEGRLISDNFYWRAMPDHPDDFAALQTLPMVSLNAKIDRRDTGDKCLLDVTLTNSTKAIALMTHIQLRGRKSNERVLPVYYADNYVTLLPGESRTISVEAASRNLKGDQPRIMLDGWNVTTEARSFTGGGASSIAPNEDAIVPVREIESSVAMPSK